MEQITTEQLNKLIRNGDLIITTKEILTGAVLQSVESLYQDNGKFDKNRYMNEREFEQLSKTDCTDISKDIIDYITG